MEKGSGGEKVKRYGRGRILELGACLLACASASAQPSLRPGVGHLKTSDVTRIQEWIRSGDEIAYQNKIHDQSMADLELLYTNELEGRVSVVYASFASDAPSYHQRGDDEGFGLHVVKRFENSERTIFVNEHWPIDRATGGLLFPDEIRLQSQVFTGERHRLGSESTYLFDSVRLAWGPSNEIEIYRRSLQQGGRMRVPVSAPGSCLQCHESTSSNGFADAYLETGETRDYEAIVSQSHFKLPPAKQRGFREYVTFLKNVNAPDYPQIEKILADPGDRLQLPGILDALRAAYGQRQWLGADEKWGRSSYSSAFQTPWQQGSYFQEGDWYLDAIEEIFEGKYRWWNPKIVIP